MRRQQGLTLSHHIWLLKWSDSSGKKLRIFLIPNPLLQKFANQLISHIKSIFLIFARSSLRINFFLEEKPSRKTKKETSWNTRKATKPTNNHLEVLWGLFRNKSTIKKNYVIVQRKMEKTAKGLERRSGDRILRARGDCHALGSLCRKRPLYGLD